MTTLTRQGLKDFLDGAGVKYADDASKHVLESLVRKLSVQVQEIPKEKAVVTEPEKRTSLKGSSPFKKEKN